MTNILLDISYNNTLWNSHNFAAQGFLDNLFQKATAYAGIPSKSMELSVVLTNDREIQALNNDYRGKDKPTNVLSFAQLDDPAYKALVDSGQEKNVMLGDIILAYETIKKEASEQMKPFQDHFTHLCIHGFLHLLGYDHIEDDDAKHMETMEIQILDALNIKNPYADPLDLG